MLKMQHIDVCHPGNEVTENLGLIQVITPLQACVSSSKNWEATRHEQYILSPYREFPMQRHRGAIAFATAQECISALLKKDFLCP